MEEYIASLRVSVNHAMAVSYRRDLYRGDVSFVGHITLIKGVPFYGYHVGYKFFLKIYILNPQHITRLAELLLQGAVLRRPFQPYESHLQYLLQWMCDYNLYGCEFIDCARVRFRSPVPALEDVSSSQHRWHDGSIPASWVTDATSVPRQSHCSIEVDVCAQDILNRKEVRPRAIHHDFLERFMHLEPDQKFVHSVAGLWRDETIRRKKRMGLTDPSSSPFPPEVLISMSANARDTGKGGWVHEEEYREMITGLIKEERNRADADCEWKFETFVQATEGEERIRTALESVEDLFPENLLQSQSTDPESEASMQLDDLTDVAQAAMTQGDAFNYGSDEEASGGEPGKDLGADPNTEDEIMGRKRHLSEAAGLDISPTSSPSKRVAFVDKGGSKYPQRKHTESDSLPSSQSSQRSIKAFGVQKSSTLSFPTVKDPQDPGTQLRLSQGEFSSSQQNKKLPSGQYDPPEQSKLRSTPPAISQRLTNTAGLTSPTMWTVTKSASASSSSKPSLSKEATRAAQEIGAAFGVTKTLLHYGYAPPSPESVGGSMIEHGLPPVIYQDAHYSDEKDVPDRPREYAGRIFKLESTTVPFLPAFDPTANSPASFGEKLPITIDTAKQEAFFKQRRRKCNLRNWQIAAAPPSFTEVEEWITVENMASRTLKLPIQLSKPVELSQIDSATQKNKHGFKYSQQGQSTSVQHETQYMSTMALEVHVNTRASLQPDPAEDEIACVCWCIEADDGHAHETGKGLKRGVLVLSEDDEFVHNLSRLTGVIVESENNELDLLNRLVDIVRELDPDILTGYEVHNGSWGYLIERARLKYEYNLCDELSRMMSQSHGRFGKEADRWGFTHTSTIRITGRHMINIWRAMRGELNLLQYSMENVAFHLLHRRIPHYSYADLTRWYRSGKPRELARTVEYFFRRAQLDLAILEANELIPRTSEQARLLGVDFFSVFSRGSQFKVESLMFRIAKPESFLLPSPSRKQVGQQNALECLPLVMEPQSAFYNSPLLVLDFQSLYPSVMIAYNYCYSTCLGRVVNWRGRNKLGFSDFKRDPGLLELVEKHVNISPNGLMYVRPEMRKSLLAKMLSEILETRVMVKSGMKADKNDRTLQQLLNNRQLALKLIANVTYGYTSASFSGRMPCSEIADSIVQTARETLEKAIALIHSVKRWGAEVVYGDTDSLFIYLKGRSKDEAFDIGNDIADTITRSNPRPVKLKFEKVYFPCVLLAKKRYVGFKYESRNQVEPEFDAKGIETVRRDGTPAEQKIEEHALKLLFRTADLSQVKRYFQRQCTKIMSGRVSIQDFLFAKEVRLGTYSDRGPPPPGALIATRRMMADRRAEPQYGERVPYVVITGAPGARLIDRCVAPEMLLQDDQIELDAEYYISKNLIPPLERIFNLVGANVRQWYDEMPKVLRIRPTNAAPRLLDETNNGDSGALPGRKTLESYLKSSACLVCRDKLPPRPPDAAEQLPVCDECASQPAVISAALRSRLRKAEMRAQRVDMVCRSCSGLAFNEEVRCDSRDCPVFYTRVRERATLKGLGGGILGVLELLERQAMKEALEW